MLRYLNHAVSRSLKAAAVTDVRTSCQCPPYLYLNRHTPHVLGTPIRFASGKAQRAPKTGPDTDDPKTDNQKKKVKKGNPKNEEIRYRTVYLVDAETGQLNPTPLVDILNRIDKKKEFVELVAERPHPVVKVQNQGAIYRKKKELRKRAQENAVARKEIQLTWGTDIGDLQRKLKKAREELERGNVVDLIFARKKGQPLLTPVEMKQRVQQAVEALEDVSKEYQSRSVQKFISIVFLKGIKSTSAQPSSSTPAQPPSSTPAQPDSQTPPPPPTQTS